MKKTKRSGKLSLRWVKPAIILLLSLNATPLFLHAQETWIKQYDPFEVIGALSETYSIGRFVKCKDGYVISGFYEYIDSSNVSGWGFLMKIDFNGNVIWTRQDNLHTGIKVLTVTSEDGYLYSGWERFSENRYLIKRDAYGSYEWMKPHIDFCPYTISNTDDGNIILAGKSINFKELVIKKATETGEEIWSRRIPFNDNSLVNLLSSVCSSDGNYVFCGWIDILGEGNKNTFVIKLDHDGNMMWSKTYEDLIGEDRGIALVESSNKNIFVVGNTIIAEKKLGLFWLLDKDGNTINFKLGDGKYANGCSTVLPLQNGEFICGGPNIVKMNEKLEILWERDYLCGGSENKICFTEEGGFIFPARYDNCFTITKTDSLGLVYDMDTQKP